MGKLVSPSI